MTRFNRNLNIEVLRCFLMLVIVVYHGSNNGPYQVPGQYPETKVISWAMTWATNAFVFISGWYGIRFSMGRLVKFLLMGLYAALTLFAVSKLVLGSWCFRYSLGWFGNSYLALMLFSPLVNAAIEGLNRLSPNALRKAWACYSLAMLLSWLPSQVVGVTLDVAGWGGHTFNTLLYVYVSARVLRNWSAFCSLSVRKAAATFLSLLALHLGLQALYATQPFVKAHFTGFLDYDSPVVLVMGAMIFLVFSKTSFPMPLQKFCGWMAPSMFSVYLLHTQAVSRVGGALYNNLILSIAGRGGGGTRVAAIFIAGFVAFAGCLAVDLIRRFAMHLYECKMTKGAIR